MNRASDLSTSSLLSKGFIVSDLIITIKNANRAFRVSRVKSCILRSAANLDYLIRYRNPCPSRQQCLGKPFNRQVAAQPFFACPIEDEAGHGRELPAELVITRFVGK